MTSCPTARTCAANLILLCPAHHHTHHEQHFTIEPQSGAGFRFTRADGTPITDHLDPAAFITTDVWLENEHADLDATAATTRWGGERLDPDYAISVIAQHRQPEIHTGTQLAHCPQASRTKYAPYR